MNTHFPHSPRWSYQQFGQALRERVAQSAKALLLLCLLGLLLPMSGRAQCMQMVWHDEFSGTAVDTTQWKFILGDGCPSQCGFGNSELENYRAQNATVTGGNLVITTKYETTTTPTGNTRQYSSAKLESKVPSLSKLQTFKYGRIEANMQLPSAGGVWPAFWMMPDPSSWPSTGEIDIMEGKNKNPTYITGTAIGGTSGKPFFMSRRSPTTVDLSQGFHQYALEWGPDYLRFYVDNVLYNTVTPQTTPGGLFPFNDSRFYLILNAAVGGPNTGYTGKVAPTPADYPVQTLVDYVRVYSGTYNYGVIGDAAVYQNEQYKNYRIAPLAGATYTWTVPAGATIVSGQGTSTISVNWGTMAGNVAVTLAASGCPTNTYSKAVTLSAPLVVDKVYEDFEANRFLTYSSYSGTFDQAAANPAPAAPNTSATVGKYVRNPIQYDVINVRNLTVSNANDFVAGRKKVYLDVYSSAQVGSRVTMQFENSAVTTASNYPTGRHSAYKAFTSKQNAWETLEFDYEKTVDANTSIFAVDNVVFMVEPGLYTSSTYYLDNLVVKTQPTPPVVETDVLENYDGTSRITFEPTLTAGTYSAGVANPAVAAPNTSATVARYVRNPNQQYDGLVFTTATPGGVITDAGKFKNQSNQLLIDVYTDAPVGTLISVNMQNRTASAGTYPAGRNSTYLAKTTVQNAWETLTLVYNSSPDAGSSNLTIDELVFLLNSNSYTGNTYYLDNLRVVKHVADPVYNLATVFEDYEATHNLTYLSSAGTYQPTLANPAPAAPNTSANVARYARNAAASYDALLFSTALIKDGSAYKAGDKVFAMDLYTTAPVGTLISCQLESSALSQATNYPTGRHSIYQAVVQQTNAWQTLQFSYSSTPDAATTDADVDKLVFLFAPNTSTSAEYYLDNIRSLSKVTNTPPTVSLTSPTAGAMYPAPASITLTANAADADGTIAKVEFYNGATLLNSDTTSPYSYVWTGVAAGTYSLTAKATDNLGATTTSGAISVTVTAPPVNLALGKRVVASSTQGTLKAANAVDGSPTTRWGSAYSDDQWIYVDLGTTCNVSRVKITWQSANSLGKDYTVEMAPDSVSWSPIKTVTGNTAKVNDWTGLAGTGRFLRMHGTKRGTTLYGYSIYELEAYGNATGAWTALATAAPAAAKQANRLVVFPNPVTASLTMAGITAFPATVGVYDAKGSLVRSVSVAQPDDASNLDFSALKAGLYLLRATSIGSVQTLRFVKQ